MLLVRSTDGGQECPWPWKRTKSGNMRYQLPGHLLFSPWPPNFQRMVRRSIVRLRGVSDRIQALASTTDFAVTHLPYVVWYEMLGPKFIIPQIKSFQGFAMSESMAALDRWSNEPGRGKSITLRMSQRTLVYDDGPDHCEIEIPDALTHRLCAPSIPDNLELHAVRAGERSYYP